MPYELYQERILDHYKNPRNFGEMEDADVKAQGSNPLCGDDLTLFLKLDGRDRIEAVRFKGRGCAISQASASMLTLELEGKDLTEAATIGKDTVLEALAVPISNARMECALLPLTVLGACLEKARPL